MAFPKSSPNISDHCDTADIVIDLSFDLQAAEAMGYSRADKFYIGVFLPCLCSLGVVLNSAFLFVVHRVPTMKTITNLYLVNVAIADIVFLSVVIVFKVTKLSSSVVTSDVAGLGPALCVILLTAANITRFASLGFISAVTWERFCAVCRPYSRQSSNAYSRHPSNVYSRHPFTKTNAVAVTITIWLSATVLSASIIPAYGKFVQLCMVWPETEAFTSWPDHILVIGQVARWASIYSNAVQTIPFFATFVLNVYLYVRIIRGLDAAMVSRHQWRNGGASESDTTMRAQTIRMLVVNGVAYFLCLALFQALSLYKTVTMLVDRAPAIPPSSSKVLLDVARTLEYMNSVINPLIYTIMSRRYRDAFAAAFRRQHRLKAIFRTRTTETSL